MIRRRVVVHGRVQGVRFRDLTGRAAEAGGVAGWVRNRPDGTVEAVFEGPSAAVGELVEWCRLGPPEAAVTRLDVHEETPTGLAGFVIEPEAAGG